MIPTTGRPPPNDDERNLFALPARLGGLALSNPTQASEFSASMKVTESLTNAIMEKASYSYEVIAAQLTAKSEVASLRRKTSSEDAEGLKELLSSSLVHATWHKRRGHLAGSPLCPLKSSGSLCIRGPSETRLP